MVRHYTRIAIAALAVICLAGPALSGTIIRPTQKLYQAQFCTEGPDVNFGGYAGASAAPDVAVAGVLEIGPGGSASAVAALQSRVSAAMDPAKLAQYAIEITSVTLRKTTPDVGSGCAALLPVVDILQEGTPNIRLWWPLMYEAPGTQWTLTISYTSSEPWDDDGAGPNPPSLDHTNVWKWVVDVNIDSLRAEVALFGQLPFGASEVPLISDEPLRQELSDWLDTAAVQIAASNWPAAIDALVLFELAVQDACISVAPGSPGPTGPGTGIANTPENPACCKLILDAEALLAYLRVQSSLAPDVSKAVASPSMLTTSNGATAPITIKGVTDPGGHPLAITITGITQDEPTTGGVYGKLAPDGAGIGTSTATLRAERCGSSNGRAYRVSFTARNSAGLSTNGFVTVGVPVPDPKRRSSTICVDDGQIYDSTAKK